MKKIIAWPIAWLFYYIGDAISRIEQKLPKDNEWELPYRVYNWFLVTSSEIQDWGNLSEPWTNIQDKQTEE